MKIYIVRHGETEMNQRKCLQGWVNSPLNENGIAIAKISAENMKEIPFDILFTSPLSRAKDTGLIIKEACEAYQGKEIPVIEDDRLKEMYFGEWEGLSAAKENFEIPTSIEEYNLIFSDIFHFKTAPSGESAESLIARADEFLQEVIHNPEYEDKTILMTTHGCCLRAMLNRYYENKQDFWQGRVPYNCAVNIIEAHNGESKLVERDKVFYDLSLCVDHYDPEK